MRPARFRRGAVAALSAAALLSAVACGGGEGEAATPSTATPTSRTYTTRSFAMPLTLTLPPALDTWRASDTRTFLTWVGPANMIRFLLPEAVYRPGGGGAPEKPPGTYEGYLAYLREHSRHHATWRDERSISVDGRSATLLIGTSDKPLDGSLGCITAEANLHEDCYGLQPEYELRVAVIDAPGRPLLAWSTINTTRPQDRKVAFPRFEGMLRTLEFR